MPLYKLSTPTYLTETRTRFSMKYEFKIIIMNNKVLLMDVESKLDLEPIV